MVSFISKLSLNNHHSHPHLRFTAVYQYSTILLALFFQNAHPLRMVVDIVYNRMNGLTYKFHFLMILAAIGVHLSNSQCQLSFTLPNIIKDLVTLTYNNGQQQASSYPYFPSMFSNNPNIAYSIAELDIVASNTFMNFYLDVVQETMMFSFYFNAPSQTWTKVTVNIWITSRNDLILNTITLQSIPPGQTSNHTISLTSNPNTTITSNAKHVLFIVGIYSALIGNNFTVNVSAGPTTPAAATIAVTNGLGSFITNITICSVIFDGSNSQFLSNAGQVTYKSFSSQFLNLYNNFVPVYYYLVGINSFSITSDSIKYFGYLMSINSTILSLQLPQNNTKYDSIGFAYLSIGAQINTICANCNNNFITDSGCLDICPVNTFPYNYPAGGKACLQCPTSVGLKINDLATGCSCLPGYQLLTTFQCVKMSASATNCSGQNVIQNGSSCICSPGTYNISGQCQSCQSNQYFNTLLQSCSCTMMNQVVNSAGLCVCQPGYNNVSNFCIPCPDGTVFMNGTCAPTSCPENQILSNGKCICDSLSVKKGSACQKCLDGTFPNTTSNLCSNCIPNCVACNNNLTCQICNTGYAFDFSSLSCISMGNSTSSNVTLRAGFPVFTYTAIVIDFVINSAATLSLKTPQQLIGMIKMSYPLSQALPYRILFKQFPSKLNQIRVTFDYRGLVPYSPFVVSFSFSESVIALNSTVGVSLSRTSTQVTANVPE